MKRPDAWTSLLLLMTAALLVLFLSSRKEAEQGSVRVGVSDDLSGLVVDYLQKSSGEDDFQIENYVIHDC